MHKKAPLALSIKTLLTSDEDAQRQFLDGYIEAGGFCEEPSPDNDLPWGYPWIWGGDMSNLEGKTPYEWGKSWWLRCRPEVLPLVLDDEERQWERQHEQELEELHSKLSAATAATHQHGLDARFDVISEVKTGNIVTWSAPGEKARELPVPKYLYESNWRSGQA